MDSSEPRRGAGSARRSAFSDQGYQPELELGAEVDAPAPIRAGTVVVSADLAVLERAFVEAVRALKAGHVVKPVLVVVGSHLQHVYLRRRLARELTAVANVRFLTLMDLAGEVSLAHSSAGPRPLLPEGAQVPLLEQVIARHRTGLGEVNLVHAIAALLRDLRQGGIDPQLLTAPPASAWMGDLAAIARAYRAALEPYVDRTRTLEEAAAAGEQEVAQVLGWDGSALAVLVYGVYHTSALQLELLCTLGRVLPTTVYVPWRAGAEPFAFTAKLVERLGGRGFQLQDAGSSGRDAQRAAFSCADRQAEIEEAVRRVLDDLRAGVPAAEIALLHRLDQVFDEMVAGVLNRAGVPCYRAAGRPVRRSIVGRVALNLLHLLYEEAAPRAPAGAVVSSRDRPELGRGRSGGPPGALGGAEQGAGDGQGMAGVRDGAGVAPRAGTDRRNRRRAPPAAGRVRASCWPWCAAA